MQLNEESSFPSLGPPLFVPHSVSLLQQAVPASAMTLPILLTISFKRDAAILIKQHQHYQ